MPKNGEFRVQSDFGGSIAIMTPDHHLIELGRLALSKVKGIWTYARVDFLDWDSDPKVSELELIEPDLFLGLRPASIGLFSDAIGTALDLEKS